MIEQIFWSKFAERSAEWSTLVHANRLRDVFESIDSLLQALELPYCFDITSEDDQCLLIFSPEGDDVVAQSIDRLVDVAPTIPGWNVLARRPKKDISDAAAIVRHLYLLDPLQMVFLVRDERDRHIVEMIVPEDSNLLPDEAQGMINTFLWHAVGENFVMANQVHGRVRFQDHVEDAVPADEMVRRVRVLPGNADRPNGGR